MMSQFPLCLTDGSTFPLLGIVLAIFSASMRKIEVSKHIVATQLIKDVQVIANGHHYFNNALDPKE